MPPATEIVCAHSTTTGAESYSSPAVATNGTVYFGAQDNKVRAVNPDGTLKWIFAVASNPGTFRSSPAIGLDGTIYIGCYNSYIYALNPSDGSVKWQYQTGYEVISSPGVGTDGSVYVGSTDNKVYAFPPGYTTGAAPKWIFTTGNTVYSS